MAQDEFDYGAAFRQLRQDFGLTMRDIEQLGVSHQSLSNFENHNTGIGVDLMLEFLGQLPAALHEYTTVLTATPLDTYSGFQRFVNQYGKLEGAMPRTDALALRFRIRYAATGEPAWLFRAVMLDSPALPAQKDHDRAVVRDYLQNVPVWTSYEFSLLRHALVTVLPLRDVAGLWPQLSRWRNLPYQIEGGRQAQQVFTLLLVCREYKQADLFAGAWKCLQTLNQLPALNSDPDNRFSVRGLEASLLMRDPDCDTVAGRRLFGELIAAAEFLQSPETVVSLRRARAECEQYLAQRERQAVH